MPSSLWFAQGGLRARTRSGIGVMMQPVKLALCIAFHLSFLVNILVRNVMQMSMWCFTALRHQRVSVIDIVPLCDKTTEYFLNVQPCSFITSS